MENECYVRDASGNVVTVAPQELCFRYIKHACADGEYTVTGPGVALRLRRQDGVVYPLSGTIDRANLDSLQESAPDPESN
jgi:hypothetical protein